jgi:predicted DNA-binding protein (UPF0251 family)
MIYNMVIRSLLVGGLIMPRRRRTRMVQGGPMANVFKPDGIPASEAPEVILPVEGLEALRLSDLEKLDQQTAAARMDVSRQTFGRVLAEARELVAEALVMGKIIRIQGGAYALVGVSSSSGTGGPRGRHRRGRGRSR